MRKLYEFEIGTDASLNGRNRSKLSIGIPKKARVSPFRVESDLTRAPITMVLAQVKMAPA